MDANKIAEELTDKLRQKEHAVDSLDFYCAFVSEYWKYPKYLGVANISDIYYKTRGIYERQRS
jgi:hypothetical protein